MDSVQPTVYQCTLQLRFRTYWSFPCTGWAQHAAEPWHHTPQLTLDGWNVSQFDKSMTLHIRTDHYFYTLTWLYFLHCHCFYFIILQNNSFVWLCSISWMRYIYVLSWCILLNFKTKWTLAVVSVACHSIWDNRRTVWWNPAVLRSSAVRMTPSSSPPSPGSLTWIPVTTNWRSASRASSQRSPCSTISLVWWISWDF